MSKKPAEGWCEGQIVARRRDGERDVLLPVVFQDIAEVYESKPRTKAEWFPAHAAPDRAFEPAEPDALAGSERMYVDNPEMDGFDRMTGWADIVPRRALNPNKVSVRFVGEQFCHPVLRVACHREGPQSEPPEGGVFLGRYHFPFPNECLDLWWADGAVWCGGSPFPPEAIEAMTGGAGLTAWKPALAVARVLGLVDTEAEPD